MYCPSCSRWHGATHADASADSFWTWFQEDGLLNFLASVQPVFKGNGKGGAASSSATAPLALPAPPASTAGLEAQIAELVERVGHLEARLAYLEAAQAPPPQ